MKVKFCYAKMYYSHILHRHMIIFVQDGHHAHLRQLPEELVY